jgi:hypothetical protein
MAFGHTPARLGALAGGALRVRGLGAMRYYTPRDGDGADLGARPDAV